MRAFKKRVVAFAICLSALAGFVDAIGFLKLGGMFVSFMSGNSTQLAVALARQHWMTAAVLAGIIIVFMAGVFTGSLVGHFGARVGHAASVLALVSASLILAFAFSRTGHNRAAIALMAFAMGAENGVFQRQGDVVVGLTYMTGTLVKVSQKLANALLGGPSWEWAPWLGLWAGLIAGGLLGAVVFERIGLSAIGFAGLTAFFLTLVAVSQRAHLAIFD